MENKVNIIIKRIYIKIYLGIKMCQMKYCQIPQQAIILLLLLPIFKQIKLLERKLSK